MKKLILITTFFIVVCCLNVYAQIEKGTLLLGGSANTGYYFYDGDKTFNLSIHPNIGKFLNNNLAVGAGLLLEYYKYKGNYYSKTINYGVGPFLRYYFKKRNNKAFFLYTDFGFSNSITKSYYNKFLFTWQYGMVGLGMTYFINKNIGLEGILIYDYSKLKGWKPNSSLRIDIGFQIYLNKSK